MTICLPIAARSLADFSGTQRAGPCRTWGQFNKSYQEQPETGGSGCPIRFLAGWFRITGHCRGFGRSTLERDYRFARAGRVESSFLALPRIRLVAHCPRNLIRPKARQSFNFSEHADRNEVFQFNSSSDWLMARWANVLELCVLIPGEPAT